MSVHEDAKIIINEAISACLPDAAVCRALKKYKIGNGRLILVAVGKAAWQMASCAVKELGEQLSAGIVITKYGHSYGDLPKCEVIEAGHPVPDENTYKGTARAISLVSDLSEKDQVLFLLSGGGSSLFELPLVTADALTSLTKQLLACGADIVEMNTIRKRLSKVKGGRFAQLCSPASIYSIVLSDIIGDPLDMIASGPAYPDVSTCAQAIEIAKKYSLSLTPQMEYLLRQETPKTLNNVETVVSGSVSELCRAAADSCERLGYEAVILTDSLCCQAREAGSFLASVARSHGNSKKSLAFLAGGETVVKLIGDGKGGRNQELALSAATGIAGMKDTLIFSVGSDGTDGPTDAAGGIVDGTTAALFGQKGMSIYQELENNNAYYALEKIGGLIVTGPTGTNVNDVAVVLIKR